MKAVIDFRKYDGIIGGVEQGVVQVVKCNTSKGVEYVMLCKKKNLNEVETLFSKTENLKIVPLDVENHSMGERNSYLDSNDIQDIAENEGAGI